MTITSLGYALLGLLSPQPNTGYALRKVFETTPLGAFSSSPGSIYPALNKLLGLGLIAKEYAAPHGKPLFHLTKKGRRELVSWLSQAVTIDDVAKHPDLVILRFSFLESANSDALTLKFLSSFKQSLAQHRSELTVFMRSDEGKALSVYGRLAMDSGIRKYRAHWDWVNRAITEFSKSTKK